MIGRKVKVPNGEIGTVMKWDPLGHGACDAQVKHDGYTDPRVVMKARIVWYASTDLRPADGLGPLPSRSEAREQARCEAIASLEKIRADHVRDFGKPWPGAEHGKAIIGNAIDGAIASLKKGES